MLETMASWPGQEPHCHDFGSPSGHCRVQAAFPFQAQHQKPSDHVTMRSYGGKAHPDVLAQQECQAADAATQTSAQAEASISPPSVQLSDSADSEATIAEERQQQAEPLLRDDELRFTMYPIK